MKVRQRVPKRLPDLLWAKAHMSPPGDLATFKTETMALRGARKASIVLLWLDAITSWRFISVTNPLPLLLRESACCWTSDSESRYCCKSFEKKVFCQVANGWYVSALVKFVTTKRAKYSQAR